MCGNEGHYDKASLESDLDVRIEQNGVPYYLTNPKS